MENVNAKLYLEYIRFRDETLRKMQKEIFSGCYKIDVLLNIYEILVEKTKEPKSKDTFEALPDDVLEQLYCGWVQMEKDVFQGLEEYVNQSLESMFGKYKAA